MHRPRRYDKHCSRFDLDLFLADTCRSSALDVEDRLFHIMCMWTDDSGKFNIPHCELVTWFRLGQIPASEVAYPFWNNIGKMFDYCQEITVIS